MRHHHRTRHTKPGPTWTPGVIAGWALVLAILTFELLTFLSIH